jgi:hypothetical protein
VGRLSKLTPEQWEQLKKRLDNGESAAALSREYGVSQPVISNRFSKQSKDVRKTAELIAEGQNALAALPIAQQYQAISLAEKLRNISNSLAHAAENGAATAHRLSAIANTQAQKINDADPMESQEQLQAISALTKIANDAASLGLGLVNANKGTAQEEAKPQSRVDMRKLSTAALEEILAARDGN